jgi:hypothetical protein
MLSQNSEQALFGRKGGAIGFTLDISVGNVKLAVQSKMGHSRQRQHRDTLLGTLKFFDSRVRSH